MKTVLSSSVAGLVLLFAPSAALAACNLGDATAEQQLAKIEGIQSGDYGVLRRDARELRSAAIVLQRYGQDEACAQVVTAINTLLTDPRAASDMRNTSMGMKSGGDTAAATGGDATAATPATPAPAASPMMTMDQRRTGAVGFAERQGLLSASELIGTDVYGPDNNSVGEIEDIVMAAENQPAYALISYGGFLGMGQEQAAVPIGTIRFSEDNYAFVNFTGDQLRAAPTFKRGTSDWWGDQQWRTENEAYYNSMNP